MNDVLRRIRESRGLKQIDVARRTGLSKQMISKMESPEGNPTLITLLKYLECIDVDLAEVLKKQIPMEPICRNFADNGYDEIIPYEAICPTCGYEFEFGTWNDEDNHHCVCGQAIDWSDE